MGSIAVVALREAGDALERARHMLHAAPHRGDEHQVAEHGRAVLAVSNDPAFRDSWLARGDGLLAAFSGALDNRETLVAALGLDPHADPAAVVLSLFRRKGFPAELRGNFAGAVTDGVRTWVFRDQFGFRTLFVRRDNHGVFLASEAKQVLAGARVPRRPDVEAVTLAFYDRLDGRRTTLEGVERFPRATVCETDGDRTDNRVFWDPSALLETSRLSLDEAVEGLRSQLARAVGRAVTGRDIVLLSGGLDSPAVAAFAAGPHRERSGQPLAALSRLYPDHPEVDEERYIRLVADRLGLDLHTYASDLPALADTERWVDILDGPSNVLLLSEVAGSYERAKALGARTVMTGELAEYVFAQEHHLIGHLLLNGRIRAIARWVSHRRARRRPWHAIAREMVASSTPPRLANAYLRRRGASFDLAPWIGASGDTARFDLDIPARRRWAHFQLAPYTGAAVSIEAADICAAACGVHERKPLADVDLWEFMLSLRAEIKYPDPLWKGILRRALRGRLPDEIVDRRDKTAFDAALLDTADYDGLERCIVRSEQRLPGINYASLRERIAARDLKSFELLWAYDLARAHAFLDLWA